MDKQPCLTGTIEPIAKNVQHFYLKLSFLDTSTHLRYLPQKHAKPKTHRGRAANVHDSESLWHCEMAMSVHLLLETTLW